MASVTRQPYGGRGDIVHIRKPAERRLALIGAPHSRPLQQGLRQRRLEESGLERIEADAACAVFERGDFDQPPPPSLPAPIARPPSAIDLPPGPRHLYDRP